MIELKSKIHIPIYNGTVVVVFTDEDTPYNAAIKYFNYDNDELKTCGAATLTHGKPGLYPVIFTNDLTDGTITHECFHILNQLYNRKGIIHSNDNDEHGAYILGWLVNEVYKVKDKFNKLKNDTTGKETVSVR